MWCLELRNHAIVSVAVIVILTHPCRASEVHHGIEDEKTLPRAGTSTQQPEPCPSPLVAVSSLHCARTARV